MRDESENKAAATAAAAWSARFIGTLNKAITASPMYLSMDAPVNLLLKNGTTNEQDKH